MTSNYTVLENYKQFQQNTQIKEFDIKYMALGLGGEIGEVQNEIKKMERDDNNILTEQRRHKIITEMGDVMWYLTGLCNQLNCSIEDVINNNINKLSNSNQQ